MAKPPIRRDCSDFVVTVDGQEFHPHEGEWVEMSRSMTVKELRAFHRFQQFVTDMQASEGDSDQNERMMRALDEDFETLTAGLATRIRGWNWTDNFGEPLPQPDGDPETFANLTAEELFYLIALGGRSETPEERGNA